MLKILMIDDDREELMLVREMIDAAGGDVVHVEWVASASQALTMLSIDEFGLFLVDRDLGGELGADFIQRARDAGIDTPAIIYTGTKEEDLDEKSRRWIEQGVGYIHKSSVESDELLAALRRHALHSVKTLEVFLQGTGDGVPERAGRYVLRRRACHGLDEARIAAEDSFWELVVVHVPDLGQAACHDVLRLKAGYGLRPMLLISTAGGPDTPLELQPMLRADELRVLFGAEPDEGTLARAINQLVH